MSRLARLLVFAAVVVVCSAHVGSPDAWYEGPAGPYRVLVHIELPGVVPGIATISVRAPDADRVTAFVNKFDATEGTPPADVAAPIPGNPGWYRTKLWVMAAGSNGVTVMLAGAKGTGSVIVPVTALAGRRLGFSAPRIAVGIGFALILAAGFLSILRAAKREGILAPGVTPGVEQDRDGQRMMIRGGIIIAVITTAMSLWWRSVDASFKATMFTALHVRAHVDTNASTIVLTIDDSLWTQRNNRRVRGRTELSDFVEDHGKLMHLFMISNDGRTAFAHVHPHTRDSVTFIANLPPLPAGSYRVFADVVHETGLTETLTSSVTVQATTGPSDRSEELDDTWGTGAGANAERISFDDGTTLTRIQIPASIVANEEASLRFAITPPAGDTATLQPYLGMPGHAVVVRNDGRVFIHLHPMGTISMAAQSRLTRNRPDTTAPHSGHAFADTLYFPYAFPEPGSYTLWVQIKRRDRVMTSAFAIEVGPATGAR